MTRPGPHPTSLLNDSRLHLAVLVALALIVIGYNLGSNSLHNWDEAKHAVIAREMVKDNQWISPTFQGNPYYFKPPLRMWLSALSFKVAGISEWTVRLWSGLFALGTVLTLYLCGRRLWGTRTAFFSAFILLTSHQYIYNHCARTGETDSMLIFCWTAGLLTLQLALEERSARLLYLSGAVIGLCGMVKHLGFIPIALSVAVGYALLSGAWRVFPLTTWLKSLGVLAGVALPWHLVQLIRHGREFADAYFLGEVVERRLEARAGSPSMNRLGQWASLVTLARGFFPWSPFLPFALVGAFREEASRRRWLMPVLWLVVAMTVTVISGRKYSWYVLPAFPAAAILVGRLLDRFVAGSRDALTSFSVVLASIVALGSVSDSASHNPFAVRALQEMLEVDFLGRLGGLSDHPAAAITAVLALTGVAMVVGRVFSQQSPHGPRIQRLTRHLLVWAIALLALHTVVVPLQYSETRSPLHEIALQLEEHAGEREILAVVLPRRKINNPPFIFYLSPRRVRRLSLDTLQARQLEGRLLLTDTDTMDTIGAATAAQSLSHTIVARAEDLLLVRWQSIAR